MPPGPPPQRKHNTPLIVGGIAGGLVLLIAIAAVAIGLSTNKEDTTKPPTAVADSGGAARAGAAAQNLAAVPALRYSGTFSSGGDQFQAQLSVTKAGSATGTATAGGDKMELVTVDGNTYLKAPKAFWQDTGGVTATAGDYAGRWSKAPDSALNLDIKKVLAPGAIVEAMRGVSSYQPTTAPQDINGTQAVKVTGAGAEYYISTAQPPKLVRIVGTGSDTYQFDVTEVSATKIAAVFQQLRVKIKALNGALDPSLRFQPTTKPKIRNCEASSCSVSQVVSAVSLSSTTSSSARAIMTAAFTGDGRPAGSCTSSKAAKSSGTFTVSCTVRGGKWSSVYRSRMAIPGRHSFRVQVRLTGQSMSSADVGRLLSTIDQEQQAA